MRLGDVCGTSNVAVSLEQGCDYCQVLIWLSGATVPHVMVSTYLVLNDIYSRYGRPIAN